MEIILQRKHLISEKITFQTIGGRRSKRRRKAEKIEEKEGKLAGRRMGNPLSEEAERGQEE